MRSIEYGAVKVGAYSFDVRAGEMERNLACVEAALAEARERGVELALLPEMWPTSFPAGALAEDELERWLAASQRGVERALSLSAELGIAIAGSAYARAAGGMPRNRLQVFANGREVLGYDKRHLFSPTAEDVQFSAGEAAPGVVELGRVRVAGVVCYDLRFGELFVPLHQQRAELLLVPAQWPTARAAHWRALVAGRAVEAQAFVLACNRCGSAAIGRRGETLEFPGNSLVVAPSGEVLAEGSAAGGWTIADIDPHHAREHKRRVPVDKDRRR
jgi:predicted amidohydrolase